MASVDQNRVSDHRIGLTLHRLDYIMNGDIGEILDALNTHFQAERLKREIGDQGNGNRGDGQVA